MKNTQLVREGGCGCAYWEDFIDLLAERAGKCIQRQRQKYNARCCSPKVSLCARGSRPPPNQRVHAQKSSQMVEGCAAINSRPMRPLRRGGSAMCTCTRVGCGPRGGGAPPVAMASPRAHSPTKGALIAAVRRQAPRSGSVQCSVSASQQPQPARSARRRPPSPAIDSHATATAVVVIVSVTNRSTLYQHPGGRTFSQIKASGCDIVLSQQY